MSTKKEKQLGNDITEITYEFRGKPEPKKWHKYLYDGKEGTIFNRTAKSWGEYPTNRRDGQGVIEMKMR